MMYLGDNPVGIVSNLPLPLFMNHLESGSFSVETTSDVYGEHTIQLKTISKPKGILLYSNGFNMFDAKSDKPLLGAFASLYIAPADIDNASKINGWTNISSLMWYFVNWGTNANGASPTARRSNAEMSRGVYLYNESTKQIQLRGFISSQSDYDFKFNHTYHWLVWD